MIVAKNTGSGHKMGSRPRGSSKLKPADRYILRSQQNAQIPISRKTGVTYEDKLTLPGEISLANAESIVEKFREYGSAEIKGRIITFSLEEEDDWNLREVLAEIETEVRSWNVEFNIDKNKVKRDGAPIKEDRD